MRYSTPLLLLSMAYQSVTLTDAFGVQTGSSTEGQKLSNDDNNRRRFLTATVATVLVGASPGAFAVVDDLAMPTEAEQKEKDDYQERLRRKAELQKKMATPKNFNESLRNERYKQSEIGGLTKEERRDRMCEELGRGC